MDTSLTIGEIFEDRTVCGDIRTSIVKVARFPPAPAELNNSLRFASLDPESSARPRKRPGPQPSPPFWGSQRNRSNSQLWESEHSDHDVRANKRRKIQSCSAHAAFNSDPPIPSSEGLEERVCDSSQISPAQMSSMIQIADSQRSPRRKCTCACVIIFQC